MIPSMPVLYSYDNAESIILSFDFVAQFVCQLYPSRLVPYSHDNTESIIFDLDFVIVFVLLNFICCA